MNTTKIFSIVAGFICLVSCADMNLVCIKDPINILVPSPTEQITKVSLTDTQAGYVEAGNKMAFRFLNEMYNEENMICSPLSLQYALAMTANGASGETLKEILDFLGYGEEGIDAMNEYCKILLEQLPAVDLNVTLKVTDAVLVNDKYPLLSSFKQTVENSYYAAVDNMDFSDSKEVAARINGWSNKNTNGYIEKVLDPSELSDFAVSYIINALYFKAKWAGTDAYPMFKRKNTNSEDFQLKDGKTIKANMMMNSSEHEYAEMDGYKVLVLPYENGSFNMYVLLPDENNIEGMIEKLQSTSWSDILANLKQDAKVHVKLPKFNIENKYYLEEPLKSLGVEKAFDEYFAEFDKMFLMQTKGSYYIEKVIQKSRITVSEWGTEAGSVNVIEHAFLGMDFPLQQKQVYFYADHPFVFIIGEKTSGTILFEGVVMQP